VVFAPAPDGTVRIDLPAVVPVTFAARTAEGREMRVSLDYRHDGLEIAASGAPGAIDYSYAAEAITLETTGIALDGRLLPVAGNALGLTLEGLAGTSRSTQDAGARYAQDLTLEAIRYRLRASDPATGSRSDIDGAARDLTFTGESTLPPGLAPGLDMAAMADAGMGSVGRLTYAANAMTFLIAGRGDSTEGSIVSQAGSLDIAMADAAVTYAAQQTDLQAEIASSRMTMPLSLSMDRARFDLAMPITASTEPGNFRLGLLFDGIALSDMMWSAFDPGEKVPRDPASVALDLAGKGRLIFDTPASGTLGAQAADLESVDIRQLRMTGAGTEIAGQGAFRFDDEGSGASSPQGALDLTLTGGNTLIDRLIAGGLLPEQQAMGLRMMLAFLAVPGDAPDEMVSRIEINDQGHVLANGQRIR
jgi:hypothetical protein